MNAGTQLNRIVTMVAALSREADAGAGDPSLDDLAARYGVTPAQVAADIRVLTLLGEDADVEWLLSLRVWQEGDRVSITSGGPFRRPIRFTPDEVLAIQAGLAGEGGRAAELCRALADMLGEPPEPAVALEPVLGAESLMLNLMREAVTSRRRVRIMYAGLGEVEDTERTIQPHELVGWGGHYYVVAWCDRSHGWRNFRVDRILAAKPMSGTFEPRSDVPAGGMPVFQEPEEGVEEVTVRFTPAVSRWIAERYPEAKRAEDGAVMLTYRVADPEWLVRQVLQYGPDAEVVAPPAYRAVMKRAVA
ncbi:MAG: helix-turn-helix transcriptional regulator [Gemmatimonadales bacterium]